MEAVHKWVVEVDGSYQNKSVVFITQADVVTPRDTSSKTDSESKSTQLSISDFVFNVCNYIKTEDKNKFHSDNIDNYPMIKATYNLAFNAILQKIL